jgi:hypothetical protein
VANQGPGSLYYWLTRTAARLETTQDDEQVRGVLVDALAELSSDTEPRLLARLIAQDLEPRVAQITCKDVHERILPTFREHLDQLSPPGSAPDLAAIPPNPAGPVALPVRDMAPPGAPRNVPNRPGCLGGGALLLLRSLFRLG